MAVSPARGYVTRQKMNEAKRYSLLSYAPAVVLLAAVLTDGIQHGGNDLWMHIRFGQNVLDHRELLRHDIYSYSAPGASWLNHEWLADVVMAWCYDQAGVIGLKLMKFACAAAIAILIAAGVGETDAAYPIQVGTLLAVALAIMLQVQFRPQIFDYILLAALLLILNREVRDRHARIWPAVPVMALWANLHGAFVTGGAVLAMYTCGAGAQDLLTGLGSKRLKRFSIVAVAALLATLINPFGIGAWRVAFAKFSEPIIAMNMNLEFQSLPHHLAIEPLWQNLVFYLFPMLITLAGVIFVIAAPTLDDLPLVAIAVMMTCGWVYSLRNMAFAVITWAAPLAHHSNLWLERRRPATHAKFAGPQAPLAMNAQLSLLAAAGIIAWTGGLFSPRLPYNATNPVGALAFMDRHGLGGNILALYEWGGFVVWHAAPRSKVFFDSFDERYPASVQYAYIDFLNGPDDRTARVLRQYPHDFILMPTESRSARFISSRADWRLIYRDDVASLFARSDSAAAQLTGTPEIRHAPPPSVFP